METKRSNARVKSCNHLLLHPRTREDEPTLPEKITAMYPVQIMSSLKNSDLLYLLQSLN